MAKTLGCDPNGEVTKKVSVHLEELAVHGFTGTPLGLFRYAKAVREQAEQRGFEKGRSEALDTCTRYLREKYYEHTYWLALIENGEVSQLKSELTRDIESLSFMKECYEKPRPWLSCIDIRLK